MIFNSSWDDEYSVSVLCSFAESSSISDSSPHLLMGATNRKSDMAGCKFCQRKQLSLLHLRAHQLPSLPIGHFLCLSFQQLQYFELVLLFQWILISIKIETFWDSTQLFQYSLGNQERLLGIGFGSIGHQFLGGPVPPLYMSFPGVRLCVSV